MGRTSLLMVMGFNIVFAMMGFNISNVSTRAYRNFLDYYTRTQSRLVASAGANMAACAMFNDITWGGFATTRNFAGGTITAVRGGTVNNPIVKITTSFNAGMKTLGGDRIIRDTIVISLTPMSFSQFTAYYTTMGSVSFAAGDTINGQFHCNDKLKCYYNPVFMGRASAKNGLTQSGSPAAEFRQGFVSGIDIPLTSPKTQPLKDAATASGKVWTTASPGKDVTLTFHANGKVTYQYGTDAPVTDDVEDIAPNGVFCINGGNVTVKGVYKGRISIGCFANGISGKGKVIFDSSLVAHDSPRTNQDSEDMMGIVADNALIIPKKTGTPPFYIDAAMVSINSGLTVENLSSYTTGQKSIISIFGGSQEYACYATGNYSGASLTSGYSLSKNQDTRFLSDSPPYYPLTGKLQVQTWYESISRPDILF